jgi:hypothetical protein
MAAQSPDKRYADYDALLVDLEKVTAGERIAGQLPVGRSKLSKIRVAPTVAGPSRFAKTQANESPEKSSKAPVLPIVAALVAVVAGGIYFATRRSTPRQVTLVATTSVKPLQQGATTVPVQTTPNPDPEDNRPNWMKLGLAPPIPEIEPFADAELEAIRQEQELRERLSKEADTTAWKLAKQYDFLRALKQYDALMKDPHFENHQNTIINLRDAVQGAFAVFNSVVKRFNDDVGKPIQIDGKTYTLKSYLKEGNQLNFKLILEADGKEIMMPLTELKGSDVFRLATPAQEKLGVQGCINLWRFALICGNEALIRKVNELAKKAKVKDFHAEVMARARLVLMVSTTPQGATVRVLSRKPNPRNKPVDKTPFFSVGTRDVVAIERVDKPIRKALRVTYVLEISKKGYETVVHEVKISKSGPTIVTLTLKKSQAVAMVDEPFDPNLRALRKLQEET